MKIYKVSLISLVITAVSLNANSQWEKQSPLPTESTIYDVCFVNDQQGWIVGDHGEIYRTNDNGNNWERKSIPGVNQEVIGCSFISSEVGWVLINYSDIIYFTSNGGESWNPQPTNTGVQQILDICFADELNGWACGPYGLIIHTFNGGSDWIVQSTPDNHHLESIFFTSQDSGWSAGGFGGIFRTIDGGNTWIDESIGSSSLLRDICFPDNLNGWIVGFNGEIMHSDDGGSTWSAQNSTISSHIYSVVFNTNQIGCCVGEFGTILFTNDGGATWNTQESPLYTTFFSACNYSGNFWSVGKQGSIINSPDQGQTWQQLTKGTINTLYSVFSFDCEKAIAVGINSILKTIDSGLNWLNKNPLPGDNYFLDVFFFNENNGWICCDEGLVMKTEDGGETWSSQYCYTSSDLRSICFINDSVGLTCGDFGEVYRTVNKGNDWYKILQLPYLDNLSSIDFINEENGWISGDGVVLATHDGGINWEELPAPSSARFNCIDFVSVDEGYIVGEGGSVYQTQDGGESWMEQQSGTLNELYSIQCFDENNYWICGDQIILYSSNQGVAWIDQPISSTSTFFDIHFADIDCGWTVGYRGNIWYTENGGIVGVEESQVEEIIFNVYPNPFNTSIIIQISQIDTPFALEFYNSIGRLLDVIEFSGCTSDICQIDWNYIGSVKGIIYCHLKSRSFSKVVKMIRF